MPIFQKSIVDKYLDTLDAGVLDKAYDSYKEVYSAEKIKRIKTLNEEKYQAGFLKDIFGSVLGYTIDPEVGYNIELEKKNETNSKKADGAIVQDEKVLGVIELKSNTTKNLESIKDQAFGYKNNHKGCKYVISSNFHKLRFYVDDATEYEEFDLYNLDKETFKKFYLYLRKEGLLDKNIPKLLKEETKFHEENISKQLYKDYSTFKNKFFENIVKNNPQHDKLLLFKKSQKFLDRILFVLFAEDKELIPTNAISRIVESWTFADDLHYKPLYELFTILFEHLNVGHIYKSGYEIPAYNGGLFAQDDVLDNLKVDDEILKDDLLTLSKYDFNTDVDVNILGHIFEHSLSEIEEIEAELRGEVADKSKGKRKKDGVFYTPKYITKYIVDNTVGKLCSDKKEVLGLDIDFDVQDYQKSNGTVNSKGKELFHTLESYKEWLLSLKILDPACGSGAFLNQALTFLIEEHENIDDLIAELTNTPLRIFDTDKAILENNIFGVDINDESVEIAKLSLWLRTAQRGRKLSNLNNNIKCGNSLIDDPEIAGDKAFKWEHEFPEIFAKGGFDVVIGNPPYVRVQTIKDNIKGESLELERKYESATRRYDLFVLFMEKSFELVKDKGIVNYILPHKFLVADFGYGIRKFLKDKKFINKLIHFGHEIVFKDASTYTCIVQLSKNSEQFNYVEIKPEQLLDELEFTTVPVNELKDEKWALHDKRTGEFIDKLKSNTGSLENILDGIYQGIKNTSDKIFMIRGNFNNGYFHGFSDELNQNIEIEEGIMIPVAKGKDIKRYETLDINYHVIYPHYFNGKKTVPYEEEELKLKYPKAYDYLFQFKDFLTEKKIRFKTNSKYWYSLHRSREIEIFSNDKIVTATIQNYPHFTIDKTKALTDAGGYALSIKPSMDLSKNQLLPILNSKLMWFFIKNTSSVYRGGYYAFNTTFLNPFPLPDLSRIKEYEFDNYAINNIKLTGDFLKISKSFKNYIQSQFSIEKLTKKLQNWHELEFVDFIKELNKAIKKAGGEKLTKTDEIDWMEVFETKKEEAQTLQAEIDKTDKEIDKMVYELYGLTAEEIQIVENN
ncbi:MAG: Eco57I restriction-modification methylase domain-containing protein [Algibacter sp.]|uniref:Eco57I restriction-modification methylase domain-containing protein n=1 Tax=Algibacter sp. TaxID=1872428 RepID=UPI002609C807|nr:DNA methyltransferase [Algibacter sp.]MDG1729211.1 Eco57I restriction-modification methylase domain-containing protein [Algibacter sp.]